MTKVTVNKLAGSKMAAEAAAPSADLNADVSVKTELPPGLIKDSKGRVIKVAQINALDRMHLFEFISNAKATRDRWMGLALIACSVRSIDGHECPLPATEREIEMMVQRLGDEGLSAAGEALMRLNGTSDAEIARIKNS